MTMTNIAGVIFGMGLFYSNLWQILLSTWFAPLHPVILYFAVVKYVQIIKPRKPREAVAPTEKPKAN